MTSIEISAVIRRLAEALALSPDDATLRSAMRFAVGEQT